MAVTLTTGARNASCNAIVDLIDVGTTDANGDLVIRTAANAELATLAFSNPAFGDAVVGVATANAITDDASATGGGVAANFITQNRDNAEVFAGSVGATASGEDLELSSTTINSGDTVSISSFTATMPAT